MRICSRAVEIDPYYAEAWALLAIAQSNLRYGYGRDVDDGFAAAHAALAIDPSIAEAHLPMVKRLYEKQQFEAAAAEMADAIRLGPNPWEVNKEAGRFYLFQRDVPTATRHFEKAAEVMETDFHAWAMLSSCYRALGEIEKLRDAAGRMVSEAEKAVQQDPSNGAALGILAGGHALLGNEERTRESIARALLIDPDNLNMRYNFACVLACLGDQEGAVRMLQSTLPTSGAEQVKIASSDPDLDTLRDDPRFQRLLKDAKKRHGMDDAEPAATTAA